MRSPSGLIVGIAASCLVALAGATSLVVAMPATYTPNFPRVATVYSKSDINTDAGKRAIAKFQLYVTDFGWWPFLCGSTTNCNTTSPSTTTVGQYLRQLNPNLIAVSYMHSNGYEDNSWAPSARPPGQGFDFSTNSTPNYLDLRWFLTYAGSSLTAGVDSLSTSISVANLAPFSVNDRVIVGGVGAQSQPEMLLVTAKSGSSGAGTLTVTRAQNAQGGQFPAVAHSTGDFVRTVAYAFGNQSFMLMNPTSYCAVSGINPGFGSQTWNQFLATWFAHKLTEPALATLDGVFLDNFIEHPSQYINRYQELDFNSDNVADDPTTGDAAYSAGMKDLASQVRQQLPGKLIASNTGGQAANQGAYLNGGMIEGVNQTWTNSFVGDVNSFYTSWIAQAVAPPVFVLDGGTSGSGSLSTAQTNYKAVRFELGMTLASDGYFVYDDYLTNGGHQTDWWYDEYDNVGAGTGYLGLPVGPSTQPIPGVYRRDFANGMSLANNTSVAQTVSLGKFYQKINGTQDRTVNDGSIVNSVTLQSRDGIVLLNSTATSDTTSPTVAITSPANGTTIARGTTITISATASDNVGVTRVDFSINTSLKCSDTTAPYTCTWNVPGTKGATYTLTAKAYDAAGNSSSSSVKVTAG